jgi:hypothetical protein
VGRLEATVSADAALIADLRSRLATTETKLEAELQAKVSRLLKRYTVVCFSGSPNLAATREMCWQQKPEVLIGPSLS